MSHRLLLILLLLSAHVISDLFLRPGNGIKGRSLYSYLLLHSLIHFFISMLLTLVIMSYMVFVTIMVVSGSHFLIDLIKTKLLRTVIKSGNVVDVIDQLAHIVAIVAATMIFIN